MTSPDFVVVLVIVLFLTGCFEAFVMKQRGMAAGSWAWGLVILAFWTMYPFTTGRLCLGVATFVLGTALIVVCYRKLPPND